MKFVDVYYVVKRIPRGKVVTYGDVARVLGEMRGARVVGFALHANKDPKNVPCHRVVNNRGEVADGFAFGGCMEQKKRLISEGVTFSSEKRIDLKKFKHKF
ncbi:MAG: methylated-DNA-protein-cysteine methyltransferase [Candidatus Peregrinibacteria bacterium GW2011_GWA2_33_10]|nr:MAG: methylated-DNA-protein-cysteine methyltransferase [Candidatus Peregrinibacteria bacterium GW2011_GWA2_33_10]KKP38188.1 MAG: methylated-DNA-protein-cysteine methyltransferase [Candidatus Peregrinibacteria bacterium GW2011_GWC2_33_13]OGJ48773.1 MAG: cysteine methyltransferase [Candidatus Peregrinibacteria bacterium RIFOXYA2_FULL_33_7]